MSPCSMVQLLYETKLNSCLKDQKNTLEIKKIKNEGRRYLFAFHPKWC